MVNDPASSLRVAMQGELEQLGDMPEGWVGQNRRVVEAPFHPACKGGETLLQVAKDRLAFVRTDLVDQHHADIGFLSLIQGQVQVDRIYGAADAAVGDDNDRSADDVGDAGVAEAYHRPHSPMARPFDDQEVILLVQRLDRLHDFPLQLLTVHLAVQVVAGEVLVQHDGIHEVDVLFQVVGPGHEHRVHVQQLPIVRLDLRPERLYEADTFILLLGKVHERNADGGFAAVLTGGGDEDLFCQHTP